ncbi:hypothetical protein CY35_12G078900 [Sphagnum magellanicum]|nr:hypothetical protein CY35_12G078900 [Sphagnum magellanicum]KAH9546118.1 hypothetical protein CY35_12G078900 [Sphagnum magellanicum]
MVNCSGFWACHRMQSNHVSPSTLVQETGSIDFMQVQEGSSSMNEVNPDQRLPVTQSGRQPSKKSLRVSIWLKLTLFIGTLVVVAGGVLSLVLWFNSRTQLVHEIDRRLTTVAVLRKEQINNYLNDNIEKMELVATRIQIVNYLGNLANVSESIAQSDLESAVSAVSEFMSAAVYDRNGTLKFATDPSQYNLSLSQDEINMVRNEVHFDYPIHDPTGWKFLISRSITLESQVLVGVLLAWVNASQLQQLITDRTGLQDTGELIVGAPDGQEVHLLLPPALDPSVTQIPLAGAIKFACVDMANGTTIEKDYRGVVVIAAYTPVGYENWGLVAKISEHEAFRPVSRIRIVIIVAMTCILIVGIFASLVLAKLVTAPIIELGKAAAAIGGGDMTARVNIGRVIFRDEIDDLRLIFNSMVEEIAASHDAMEQKCAEVTRRTQDVALVNEALKKEIEERMRVEVELKKAKDAAQQADKMKSQFLANMSHEIRTPLNGIINCTELCLDTRTSPEQQEYLDLVRFSAKHLMRIITDILDFSKIEAGKLEMEDIQFSLYDQLEHAVSVLAARANKKGLELACQVDQSVPDQIIGDPGRLFQVFVNLIGNSIKFTSQGEVVVSALVRSRDGDNIELLFSVRDTGIGIPKHKQSLLFQAFSQVDSSTTRLYGGTGLGLVISSKLAAAMGGTMWVESAEGKGSTFHFTASFHIPPVCDLPSSLNMDRLKDIPVLVVDDNNTNRAILVDLLKAWGMVSVGVNGVETAKHVLQEAVVQDQQFRVLLLDMWLHGEDATDLVHFLYEKPYFLGTTPRFAGHHKSGSVSSAHSVGDLDASSSDSENDEVDPEVPASLRLSMEDTTSSLKRQSESPPINSSSSSSGGSEQTIPQVVGKLSVQQGHEREQPLQPVVESPEALDSIGHPAPGRHARSSSRPTSATGQVPSIVMLTSVDHSDASKCRQLGVQVHISKPIKRAVLVRALHLVLGLLDPRAASQGKAANDKVQGPGKGLHILVAEDNIVNQRVAVTLLQKWGHTTVLACNGAEAVEKSAKENFDLILMDVQMPVLDGFRATTSIRQMEQSRSSNIDSTTKVRCMPIVAMTAHAMSGDAERIISAGMDGYISKPLNAKKLQELLQLVATGQLQKSHSTVQALTDDT